MFPMMTAAEVGVDLSGPWGRARQKVGVKQDALAGLMKYPTHHQLSAAVAGQQHLSLQRLLLLLRDEDGRRFLRAFAQEVMEQEGLEFDAMADLLRIERLTTKFLDRLQKRIPVKAELREKREERSA